MSLFTVLSFCRKIKELFRRTSPSPIFSSFSHLKNSRCPAAAATAARICAAMSFLDIGHILSMRGKGGKEYPDVLYYKHYSWTKAPVSAGVQLTSFPYVLDFGVG